MTLMQSARRGIITDEILAVSKAEAIDAEKLTALVAKGHVTIPKNVNRDTIPSGIGALMSTKINANIGTSRDFIDIDAEIEKAKMAVKYGASALMDLSTGGNLDAVRRRILDSVDIPVGTVPIYQAAAKHKDIRDMTSEDMFNAVRKHAADGVDFITVHAGVTQDAMKRLVDSERIMGVVSRGGSFTIAWMMYNEAENPFFSEYDYLLEVAAEYDITLSLGDGMRPGCLHDATDRPKFMEFITLGELVKKARKADVQTFVEGPGHVPIDEIDISVRAMKHLCDNAPLYLLGPLVTDIAPGYDHITAAIGGSVAGMHGADFLCMTTPAEHLALPSVEDIKEGTIVTKIAAHIADTVKAGQRERARAIDEKMAVARKDLDWEAQFDIAIDGEKARHIHGCRSSGSDACSMCGELCAMKIFKELKDMQ